MPDFDALLLELKSQLPAVTPHVVRDFGAEDDARARRLVFGRFVAGLCLRDGPENGAKLLDQVAEGVGEVVSIGVQGFSKPCSTGSWKRKPEVARQATGHA